MAKPAVRESPTRRTARVAPPRRPWLLPAIIGGACLAVAAGGLLVWRGRAAVTPAQQPLPALVAGAEAADLAALRALAGRSFGADSHGVELRRRLAAAVRPLLKRESGVPLLKGAILAAAHHECPDLALPMLELLEA